MVREIEWTEQAFTDLRNIAEFTSGDPSSELRIRMLLDSVEKASDFPRQGVLVRELPDINIYEIRSGIYRILFFPSSDMLKVYIVAISHINE